MVCKKIYNILMLVLSARCVKRIFDKCKKNNIK